MGKCFGEALATQDQAKTQSSCDLDKRTKSACRFVLGELVGTASTSEKDLTKILGEPPDNNGEQGISIHG